MGTELNLDKTKKSVFGPKRKLFSQPKTKAKAPQKPKKKTIVKEKGKGIIQKPFGEWHFRLGLKGFIGGEWGALGAAPEGYNAVKKDYENNKAKYWKGVVGIATPRLYYEEDSPHQMAAQLRASAEAYFDLGQIRLGNRFITGRLIQETMHYVRDTWGEDVTTAGAFKIDYEDRNIFFVGVRLAGFLNGKVSIWTNYSLDRYSYNVNNEVHKEVDVVNAPNDSELIAVENYDKGGGWGHRISVDVEARYEKKISKLKIGLPICLRLGAAFGELESEKTNWSSSFGQFFIDFGLGFELF